MNPVKKIVINLKFKAKDGEIESVRSRVAQTRKKGKVVPVLN
jgi:hypothetical protein